MFEVLAGGRRYRALELLVKQKRIAKMQAVPCVVVKVSTFLAKSGLVSVSPESGTSFERQETSARIQRRIKRLMGLQRHKMPDQADPLRSL